MAEKDQLKKIMSAIEGGRGSKITDFDTGFLLEEFETIKGSPEEKYDEVCKRLLHVYTRLKKLKVSNTDCDKLLAEIEKFFDNTKLEKVSPTIDDYSEKEGRYIAIKRSDDTSATYSCTPETFHETMRNIRMEQYFPLINKAQILKAKAMSFLENSIPWHNEDVLEEIDPTKEVVESKKTV